MSSKKDVTKRFWSLVGPELAAQGFGRLSGNHAYRDRSAMIDVIKLEFFNGATHREWGTTPYSFGLSAGIYPGFAPNPFGGRVNVDAAEQAEPDETECAVRTYATRQLRQPKRVPANIWQIKAEMADSELALADARNALREQILPWFEKFPDPQALLDLFRSGSEIMESPGQHVGFGFVESPIRRFYLGLANCLGLPRAKVKNPESTAPCFGFGNMGSPVRNLYLGFAALYCGDKGLAKSSLTAALSKGGFLSLSGSSLVDEKIHDALAWIDQE